ncbi:MAG TPA: hypothetical protein VM695_03065 [Phycisphaerae bacterium]|nr:hypothetical protein [Phycisphaerae bacterium]
MAAATASERTGPSLWSRGNRHFLLAAAILCVSAAGWTLAVRLLKIATHKEAVPWPAGVEVNDKFRLVSLPDRLGPYVFVQDGELMRDARGNPVLDGVPDGEPEIRDDVMEMLRIGTPADQHNRAERRSNWLVVRGYRDGRVPAWPHRPYQFWDAEAYYYTGGVDVVPHVPEICLHAGGGTLLGSEVIPLEVPGLPAPWNGRIGLRRALVTLKGREGQTRNVVQYYVFSLNGRPETRREVVRLKLTSPFVRHAYFAKIQFSPRTDVRDPREADEAARDFARYYLPEVLKMMPMPEDVERLSAGE